MRTLELTQKNHRSIINETCKVLSSGGLVVFPSDTVYGLLADATNKEAVDRLIAVKERPFGKAISVFIDSWEMLGKQVEVSVSQKKILKEILPGAFTVILPSKHQTDIRLESEHKTLGIRLIKHSLVNQLIKAYGKPLTATSANLSGKKPHYQLSTFQKELSAKKIKLIDLAIDAGKLPQNKPSTVIDLTKATIEILRQGDKSMDDIYISKNENATKKIAQLIFNQNITKTGNKPLVFILSGELGAGKTIFIKGIGEGLGINNIISPTYTIAYEYPLKNKCFDKLLHFDLYQIDSKQDLQRVGIEEALKTKNVLLFEWGEKVGNLIKLINKRAYIVYINIEYVTEGSRKLRVSYNHENSGD